MRKACDAREAFDEVPRLPAAGTSVVSASNEKVQMGLLLLEKLIAPHAFVLFSRYSMLVLASSKNPSEVWGAFAASRITAVGKPRYMRMNSGGVWQDGVWADLRPGRSFRLLPQGKGAFPWMLER